MLQLNRSNDKPKRWIRKLGYVAFNVTNLDETVDFYERGCNFVVTLRENDRAFLRSQFEHHCIALYQAPEAGLRHMAFETLDDNETAEMREHLESRGVTVRDAEPVPGRIGLAFQFQDLDGNWVEVYRTMERVAGIVSQGPFKIYKLGHFNIQSENPEPLIEFYRSLGFRVSDQNQIGTWLRCNEDHHGLAIVKGKKMFHHHAYDLRDWEQMKHVCDWMFKQGFKIDTGPGRHGPGNNITIYVRDPNGVRIEYYCELEKIYDEEDHVREFFPRFNLWLQEGPPEDFYE